MTVVFDVGVLVVGVFAFGVFAVGLFAFGVLAFVFAGVEVAPWSFLPVLLALVLARPVPAGVDLAFGPVEVDSPEDEEVDDDEDDDAEGDESGAVASAQATP